MSGFGTYTLESAPFSFDPIESGATRKQSAPASPKYDGLTQDLAVDANGRHSSLHPVDYGVQMGMFVQVGELLANPEIGNTLLQSTELGTVRQQAETERIVRAANPIAGYIANGSITVKRIESGFSTQTGALLVALYYRNNLTGRDEVATNQWQQAS